MRKIKLYILLAAASALTGAVLNIIWYLVGGSAVTFCTLRYYMTVGLIFGTVVTVTLSVVIMKIRKVIHAFIINAIVEAVLMVSLFFHQNKDYPQWCNIDKWIILLIVLEIISTLLTAYWYRRMHWFNAKLDEKKRELEKIK